MEKGSVFKFYIVQNINQLLSNIMINNGRKWRVEGREAGGKLCLLPNNKKVDGCTVILVFERKRLEITTTKGYTYKVCYNPRDKTTMVTYCGPLNGLLMQSLLPGMTYQRGTLRAKYGTMEEFVSVAEYMQLREERNGCHVNEHDEATGRRLNARFFNEFWPYLPKNEQP